MVKVTGYAERKRRDGSIFITLELSGSLELIQSIDTVRLYATIRKWSIPSTLYENIAKMMVGQEIEAEIVGVLVEPYEFSNPRTGELLTLTHSFSYRPKGSIELIGQTKVKDLQVARTPFL